MITVFAGATFENFIRGTYSVRPAVADVAQQLSVEEKERAKD